MKTHKTIGIFAAIICVGIIGAFCANNKNDQVELTELQERNLKTLAGDFKTVVTKDGKVYKDGTRESPYKKFDSKANDCFGINGNCHLVDDKE